MPSLTRVNSYVEPTVGVGSVHPSATYESRLLSRDFIVQSRRFVSNLLDQHNAVVTLDLPLPAFGLVWAVVVASHLLCSAFLAGLAATYYYCTNPVMAFYVQLWSPSTGNPNYGFYSVLLALVSALHALRVLQLVYRSLRQRRLVFRFEKAQQTRVNGPSRTASRKLSGPNLVARLVGSRRERYKRILDPLNLGWKALFSRHGLFGVESPHFLTVFVLREVVELSTQTYQAFRSSHLLPRVWLNNVLVAMLVTSCWSTLSIHHFLHQNPALERVVALLADAFVSITMLAIVPFIVMITYVSGFDIPNHRFGPSVSLYDPTFMAMFVLEAQFTFASTFADFAAKIIPHLAIYLTLVNISGLVSRRGNAVASGLISNGPTKVKVASIKSAEASHSTETETKSEPSKLSNFAWIQRGVKLIFCLWGFVILALHGHAVIVSNSSIVHGCRASTRPWLRSQISCSSLVVNCNTYGTRTPNDLIFEPIDSSVLATLSLAHCPALEMPSAFPELTNLMILHVYNSTVISWGSPQSSFTNPKLSTLIVARSKVSPSATQGLLLPISLSTVQFCDTNLAAIPELLPWSVHPMAIVAFDYGQLTDFPASLMSLQAFAISLKGNRLETVPQFATMPVGQMFYGIELNENPLRELPPSLPSPANIFIWLDLQSTNVSSLPPWTLTQVLGVIYMFDTPYCKTTSPESLQRNVLCFPRPSASSVVEVPFELFSQIYAFERD